MFVTPWSGLPSPPPGDLHDSGIKLTSLTSPALAGKLFTTGATWEAPRKVCTHTRFMKNLQIIMPLLMDL